MEEPGRGPKPATNYCGLNVDLDFGSTEMGVADPTGDESDKY